MRDGRPSGRGFALAGSMAGAMEIAVCHPWDTSAKRLIVNREALAPVGRKFAEEFAADAWSVGRKKSMSDASAAAIGAWRVILGDAAKPGTPAGRRLGALYPGVGYAMGYKACQRAFQYTVQPLLAARLDRTEVFRTVFASRERTCRHAVAGAIMGTGEILLLPLDSLKVRAQTGTLPTGHGLTRTLSIFAAEGVEGAWRGWRWVAARNAVGSFSFFGGAALMKEYALGLEEKDFSRATVSQNLMASSVGASTSVLISSPFDAVKTRLQRQMKQFVEAPPGTAPASASAPAMSAASAPTATLRATATWAANTNAPTQPIRTGLEIARDMIRTEGPGAFFKGIVPKLVVVSPKLMFTYSCALFLYKRLGLEDL